MRSQNISDTYHHAEETEKVYQSTGSVSIFPNHAHKQGLPRQAFFVRAIYQENSIMFKAAHCPYCQSTQIQQIRPSRDDMELMDHQSSESIYAVKHILRYAAMGGAVGRHVRFTRPLIGGALGVILGGVIGGITCGVTFHFIRESVLQQLMSQYHCRQCGGRFQRLAV